jgi:SAM-dependent methyltransferase
MIDFASIFAHQAEKYERLVSHEDYAGNLLETIRGICPLSERQTAADIGSGTGRVSFIVCPYVGKVFGIEPSEDMRRVATARRDETGRAVRERNMTIVPECTGVWHT